MSKYDEIRDAARLSRENHGHFRSRCISAMTILVHNFASYAGIPDENVRLVPLGGEPKEGTAYPCHAAMRFGEDGYWHLGVWLIITTLDSVLLELCLTEREGKLFVKGGINGKPYQLDGFDTVLCNAFYDEIVEQVKRIYTEDTLGSDEEPKVRRIGFEVRRPVTVLRQLGLGTTASPRYN